jgi:hypothetical protein
MTKLMCWYPSIISTCSWSAPAYNILLHYCPKHEKSAERIDGLITIGTLKDIIFIINQLITLKYYSTNIIKNYNIDNHDNCFKQIC